DTAKPALRDPSLDYPAESAGSLPRRHERDPGARAVGRHRPAADERRQLVALDQARAVLLDGHPIAALAPAGREVVADHRALAVAARLDPVGAVVVGQYPSPPTAVVAQELEDALRRSVDRSGSAGGHSGHAPRIVAR